MDLYLALFLLALIFLGLFLRAMSDHLLLTQTTASHTQALRCALGAIIMLTAAMFLNIFSNNERRAEERRLNAELYSELSRRVTSLEIELISLKPQPK
jgi:cell shape-determining protein MreC